MKIFSLLHGLRYDDTRPVIQLLLETSFSKEIRIALKKDQIMKEHKAPYPIVIEIVDGEIDFGTSGQTYRMVRGDLITLDANVLHDLKGISDSVVRLTLSKKDNLKRVASI